ncbi:MAG: CoA pyrophosphatase [Nocardioidaceae bacterium]|nr:CoA pyrophosphatase [Nocardioidaceae bacterium]
MSARIEAAVLVPLFEGPRGLTAVFTERHADLRKHPGEISFPGGRQDPGETLEETALREAEEEIGLARTDVTVTGTLPPIDTFVSGYRIHPFVATIPAGVAWRLQEREVAQVLELAVADLVAGHRLERLWRKGVPVRTPTYTVDGHLVWGATARIVQSLLASMPT